MGSKDKKGKKSHKSSSKAKAKKSKKQDDDVSESFVAKAVKAYQKKFKGKEKVKKSRSRDEELSSTSSEASSSESESQTDSGSSSSDEENNFARFKPLKASKASRVRDEEEDYQPAAKKRKVDSGKSEKVVPAKPPKTKCKTSTETSATSSMGTPVEDIESNQPLWATKMFEMMSQSQQRMDRMEERFVTSARPPVPTFTYTPSTDNSTFTTPQRHTQPIASTPVTPGTPSESETSAMNVSDVTSINNSPQDSQMTPDMGSMKLGSGRGRPRKQLIPPSYDDCPANASAEVISKWKKAKSVAQWCYDIKSDPL